ncbi:MAG: SpoIID/LytB domain-containing protein [Bdellovibrionales bacterium]|nr:SpoIID/LytB domain-containing protein [Bdellovibrionales bacterium]
MKEAQPGIFQAPNSEPILKVGIVLEEDAKLSIDMHAASYPLITKAEDKEYTIDKGKCFSISLENGSLTLSIGKDNLCQTTSSLFLMAQTSMQLAPQGGTEVKDVVAGRSFHWRKEINQIYSGNFSIHSAPGGIIVVNHIPFEDYLACVIASEMSGECPRSFIQAQATAARSWASIFLHNKHTGTPYSICNDDDCQRYQGTTHLTSESIAAVQECRGDFLVREDGSIVPAYYSKSCGGRTETAKACFELDLPYLSSVFDGEPVSRLAKCDLTDESELTTWLNPMPAKSEAPYCSPMYVNETELPRYLGAVDEPQAYYRWSHTISCDQIINNIQQKFNISASALVSTSPGKRGASGRYLSYSMTYRDLSGREQTIVLENQYQIRQAFHDSFLFSSAFVAQEKYQGDEISEITFTGAGWGHGVGLCQIGALGMALDGKSYEEIVLHYFPKAQLQKGYE